MITVSEIVRNKQCVELIEKYFDFNVLKKEKLESNKSIIKSNSMVGTVIEQFILITQYKNNKKSNLSYEIIGYKELINLWEKYYVELKKKLKIDHFNIENGRLYSSKMYGGGSVVIYNDFEKMKLTNPYLIVNSISPNSIQDSKPYNFIENLHNYNFLRTGQVYYLEYNQLMEIISTVFRLLRKNVYSKKQMIDIDIIKLLYFQNIIICLPYYLRCGAPVTDAHNLHKLFNNYDFEIQNLVNVLDKCKDVIAKLGNLTSYQEGIEYKEIRGRVDFVSTDSLIEIKTSEKLTKINLCQILLYMIISKASKSDLKYFKLIFPFKNLIYEYDIELILSQLEVSPEFLLDEVSQFYERQIIEKNEKRRIEYRRKEEKEKELKQKKEEKKELKRQEKIKEKAKLELQIIQDKKKKDLQLSRKKTKAK